MSLEKARDKANEWLDLIEAGTDPADHELAQQVEQERKRANSFRNVCEDFFAEKLAKERKGASPEYVRRACDASWHVIRAS